MSQHPVPDDLGHPVFDADNHYYEALDAFTRHLDPALGPRCVQWCEIGGRRYHVLGGRVSKAVSNPTFDPIAMPGAMYDYFRGNPEGRNPLDLLAAREPIRPAYREPAARLATLDQQELAGCWLFPTLGMIYEEPLRHDPEAVCHTFRAFNRWLAEDWGFNTADRIYAAPYLTLADADWAVEELTWALDAGATQHRHAPGRAHHRHRACAHRSTLGSTGSGAWPTRPGSPSCCTPATAGCHPTASRSTGSPPTSDRGPTSRRSSRSPSSGPSTTTWSAWCSRTTW